MPTLLCVPILVLDEHTALADAAAARDAGADLVEFRIDELFTGALDSHGKLDEREVRAVMRLVSQSPLPCIITCRSAAESGARGGAGGPGGVGGVGGVGGYDGDDAARVALYERLGTATIPPEHPPRYIDVEYATYLRSANIKQKINLAVGQPQQARDVRTGLILSMHDFEGRPRDLLRRVSLLQGEPAASVVKVAYAARSIRDNLELFDLLEEGAGGRPMIALGMGMFGLMSRVLAPKFGGFLTFASLRPSSATAPGQPTVRELLDLYRFESITPNTRVLGVVGWPLEHSLSPLVHNAGFDALAPEEEGAERAGHTGDAGGFDAVYLPMPVPPEWEHFKATVMALIDHPRLDFAGCSVTAPHKQHLVRLASESLEQGDEVAWEIDALSRACGAANTLVVERDTQGTARRARVVNTDAVAAAGVVKSALGGLEGRRVVLVGAGGVARAAAIGLLDGGAEVTVCNRTSENAERLVRELEAGRRGVVDSGRLRAAGMDEALGAGGADAVVNCTPVGMTGGVEPNRSPLSDEQLRGLAGRAGGGPVVFDTVYNPAQTPLVRKAAELGLRTVGGLEMFVSQAAEQFTLWTGKAAPRGLFARVCREALDERP